MKEKKILFLKTSSLGDILHTLPAALLLKEKMPSAFLSWAVEKEYVPLISAFSVVDQIFEIPFRSFRKGETSFSAFLSSLNNFRKERFDVSLDFQGNTKSGFVHLITDSKRKIGMQSPPEFLNGWTHSEKYQLSSTQIQKRYLSLLCQAFGWEVPQNMPELQREGNGNGRLLVAPFSNWDSKMLPFERLEEVLTIPYDLICGSEIEGKRMGDFFARAVNVYVKPSFPDWIALTKNASGVVGMDSAQLHLAALFGVPTFGFFGPSSPVRYGPAGPQHFAVQGDCPLKVSFTSRCPHLRTCTDMGCIKGMKDFRDDFRVFIEKILEKTHL